MIDHSNHKPQLTQIYISKDNRPMGTTLKKNLETTKQIFSNYSHQLYRDDDIQEFIKKNFDREVLMAYNKLAPYAYKSDLARYCILYELGGWYLDIGLRLSGTKINVAEDISLIAFRDQPYSHTFSSFACCNGAIYAKPKHPTTAKAIELATNNIHSGYYGVSPLCPTGPTLWGRSIAITGIDNSYLFGDFLEPTPTHRQKNKAMVLPDGTIIAYHKQSGGGDLESLGAEGTNNYNQLWHGKSVYIN